MRATLRLAVDNVRRPPRAHLHVLDRQVVAVLEPDTDAVGRVLDQAVADDDVPRPLDLEREGVNHYEGRE